MEWNGGWGSQACPPEQAGTNGAALWFLASPPPAPQPWAGHGKMILLVPTLQARGVGATGLPALSSGLPSPQPHSEQRGRTYARLMFPADALSMQKAPGLHFLWDVGTRVQAGELLPPLLHHAAPHSLSGDPGTGTGPPSPPRPRQKGQPPPSLLTPREPQVRHDRTLSMPSDTQSPSRRPLK